MIQNHSFKHQLIRDILTAIGTIVIFVWIIFSYKLYKWVYLINILAAAVWKFWQVWFNFGCFQHISALKLIKYLRIPLKESQHYSVSFIIQLTKSESYLIIWKARVDSSNMSKKRLDVTYGGSLLKVRIHLSFLFKHSRKSWSQKMLALSIWIWT